MKNVYIIIPSYNPDQNIMNEFLKKLKKSFNNIIIINDGSDENYNYFFDKLKNDYIVLTHHINQGKGRAIKTAFNYLLEDHPNFEVAVTADCDGQHSVDDIKKCVDKTIENPSSLIIGVRNFNKYNVPTKSKFGNKITRNVFKIFIGLNITDTQTGLRGFSSETAKIFLKTKGERYEYETNMLIDCKEHNIDIKEVKIKTIYIDENKTSHFNPLKDSISIYKLFLKYIASSLSAFLLDIILFTLLLNIINTKENILIATIIGRIISSMYNFSINKIIFHKSSKSSKYKYFLLVIIQMFVSGLSVTFLSKIINISSIIIKVFVDTIIFVVNFIIQREWVFKKKK
ncbi:MAG: glycosyltransferase [Bacilli bacterium]|nr:glycosyltransferase [Bacilli bacterium]